MPDKICPFCQKKVKGKAIYMHVRHEHPKELEAQTWDAIRAQIKNIPKPIYNPAEAEQEEPTEAVQQEPAETEPQEPSEDKSQEQEKESTPPAAAPGKGMQAWTDKTRKQYGYYPSPACLAIINTFSNPARPSDFINEAVINEGKRRGVSAAIITTAGGQSLELMGTGKDDDKDFDRLIKLAAVGATVNQSYGPNTPTVQIMQMMRDRVNKGMPMQEFMQMLLMMKQLEAPEPDSSANALQTMLILNKLSGGRKK